MGLISFLARRNEGERHQEQVAGHNAHRASIASPGLRGLSVAASHGSASHEDIQRVARSKTSQSHLSSPVKPFFLGIREDRSSSNLSDNTDQQSPHPKPFGRNPRDSIRNFQFPVVMPRTHRGKRSSHIDSDSMSIAPSVRSIAAYSTPDSATASASRPHRYVDILDAQGVFRPYDFKSRVKASGARDYGEDVAERNLGENAVDIRSPAAQAYYASRSVTGGKSALHEPAGKRRGRSSISFASQRMPPPRANSRASVSTYQTCQTALEEEAATSRPRRANRSSVISNASSVVVVSAAPRRPNNGKPGANRLKKRTRRANSATSQASTEQAGSQSDNDGPELKSHGSAFSLRSVSAAPHVPRFPTEHEASVSPRRIGSNISRPRSKERPANQRAPRQNEITRRTCVVEATYRNGVNHGQRQMGVDSSDESDASDTAPAPSIASYRDESSRKAHSALPNWKSPWSHFHRDSLTPPPALSDSRGSFAHSREGSWRSCTSSQARAQVVDLAGGGALGRKSSLRQWSMSSVTPTTELSDQSSNPAARPVSTHTANTSVDTSYPGVKLEGQDQGSQHAGPDFNMDDCDFLSDDSDVDSFIEKRRAESLLFTDTVFGDLGNNLPGLFDATPPKSPCVKCAMKKVPKKSPPRVQVAPQPENFMRRRDRLRSLGYEYDTDESDSEQHADPVAIKRGRTPTQRLTVASAASLRYRTAVDSRIEEDDEEEQDQVRVVHVRPMSRTSRNRMQGRHGGRVIKPVVEDLERGNAADVE